ncbi:MAG: hypothetical protein ACRD0K_04995 [Egibacteraceae bacterium]
MNDSQQTERRADWLSAGVLSGFIATGAMTTVVVLAYQAAGLLGSPSSRAPMLLRWIWGLANNTVTQGTQTAFPIAVGLHFVSGVGWALVYAAWVEPRLRGSGWRRGLLFSFVPWIVSLTVFLPAVGGGLLGLGLRAGPLPILGNLILHLIYGGVLGQVYGPMGERLLTESGVTEDAGELATVAHGQRWIALGIVAGLVVGGLVGWLGSVFLGYGTRPVVAAVLGAIAGSLGGSFIASFLGLSSE